MSRVAQVFLGDPVSLIANALRLRRIFQLSRGETSMKRRIDLRAALVFATALFVGAAAMAADPAPTPEPDPTAAQRQSMAEVHRKMAECLVSTRPFAECRAEMQASCQAEHAGGCPMMGGSMGPGMGGGMHGPGMMGGSMGQGMGRGMHGSGMMGAPSGGDSK